MGISTCRASLGVFLPSAKNILVPVSSPSYRLTARPSGGQCPFCLFCRSPRPRATASFSATSITEKQSEKWTRGSSLPQSKARWWLQGLGDREPVDARGVTIVCGEVDVEIGRVWIGE
jgi:hypothetical protein